MKVGRQLYTNHKQHYDIFDFNGIKFFKSCNMNVQMDGKGLIVCELLYAIEYMCSLD